MPPGDGAHWSDSVATCILLCANSGRDKPSGSVVRLCGEGLVWGEWKP